MGFFNKKTAKKQVQFSQKDSSFLNEKKAPFHNMKDNINYIKTAFADAEDLNVEHLPGEITMMYLETVYNPESMDKLILDTLAKAESINTAITQLSVFGESANDLNHTIKRLMTGYSVIFLKNENAILEFNTVNENQRSIEEPTNEKVIRGSHEGFIEQLSTNIGIIRNRLEHPNLCVQYFYLGKYSNTKGCLLYIKDIANPELIQEVNTRIESISSDYIQSPGYVEEFVEDATMSPFPQLLNTERPDRVVANIMEGRVAIIMDGSPTALIFPVNIFSFFQSPDDFNSRWITGSLIRFLRMIGSVIAIILPSFYIAIFTFHSEVIPNNLLMTVKASVNNLPFSPFIEALIMTLTIELIREAGIRLPSPIGQTIGIVGGIVIGQAVVQAGLISNIMIIVVGITAISSYVIPSNEMSSAIRLCSFPLMFLSSLFGFIGISFGLIALVIHLCSLESFGMPYFFPVAPLKFKGLKDAYIRLPLWMQNDRPADSHAQKQVKQHASRGWADD